MSRQDEDRSDDDNAGRKDEEEVNVPSQQEAESSIPSDGLSAGDTTEERLEADTEERIEFETEECIEV